MRGTQAFPSRAVDVLQRGAAREGSFLISGYFW